jgi:hypothetical protein
MKKLVILLLMTGLFAACNNDKGGKKADYREKDDYSNSDSKDEESGDKSKKDDNQGNFNGGDGWTESDKTKLLSECMAGFGDKQDIGKKICPCLLEKVVQQYSSYAEAEKAPQSEGEKMGKECALELNINTNQNNSNQDADDNQPNNAGSGWPQSEVQEFVNACVAKAKKNGMKYTDAQSYCECMQYKLEKTYPNISDNRLQNLNLESPEMKSMIKSCLPGN